MHVPYPRAEEARIDRRPAQPFPILPEQSIARRFRNKRKDCPTLLAASIGVWLFYVQHQFEETFWAETPAWNLHEAALHGSSHYELRSVLRWFTANIGVHHVHHLCSRISFYRLPRVLHEHPELRAIGRITLMQSLACVRLALWDESNQRMISFSDLRRSGT